MLGISDLPRACVVVFLGFGIGCGSSNSDPLSDPSGAGASSVGMGGSSGSGAVGSTRGGTASGGATQSATGGARTMSGGTSASSLGGAATLPNGGWAPQQVPPPARDDGSSPYLTACHGDTTSCVDVANLLCLGIRDGSSVAGYSCSNPCEDNADCSSASSSAAAKAECVDFVTQKHCLLVCLKDGEQRECPKGMTCYNYAGNPLGYCLWK